MRDFNFFDPYLKVQTKSKSNAWIFIIVIVLILVLIAYYQFMMILKANDIKAEIEEIDDYINSKSTKDKIAEVESKEAMELQLQSIFADISNATLMIESSRSMDDMLIEQINAQLPEGTFLSSLNMNSQVLTIEGYALEYDQIAQFAYNLRNSGGLEDLLIPRITENNGSYNFSITVAMGMEVSHEN